MAGKKVWLHMPVAAEVIVWANGRVLDGIDPNRGRVILAESARPGDTFELRLEAYSFTSGDWVPLQDPSKIPPDKDRNTTWPASTGRYLARELIDPASGAVFLRLTNLGGGEVVVERMVLETANFKR